MARNEKGVGFTLGPWEAVGCEVIAPLSVPVAWCGENVISAGKYYYRVSESEAESNARLCAAAPDMYEALSGLVKVLETEIIIGREVDRYQYNQALNALGKAQGL